ncbi:MAG: LptA/OstA family protein [Stappiaceae bacterium]
MTDSFQKALLTIAIGIALTSGAAQAQTFSNSFTDLGSNKDQPIQIEAAELEVLDQEKKAIFNGDVVVVQGDTTLKTKRLIVFYDKDGGGTQQDISKLEAIGGVLVTSKDQKATGNHAVFDAKTNTLVMTGKKVVLSQGPNVIVGNRLIINLDTGKVDLKANRKEGEKGGRVKVLLDTKSFNEKKEQQ